MSWKKKEFEDLEDLVVSFRLYFVIAQLRYLYNVLFTLINIYDIDCQKKKLIWSRRKVCYPRESATIRLYRCAYMYLYVYIINVSLVLLYIYTRRIPRTLRRKHL
jgi:hypothetical protein